MKIVEEKPDFDVQAPALDWITEGYGPQTLPIKLSIPESKKFEVYKKPVEEKQRLKVLLIGPISEGVIEENTGWRNLAYDYLTSRGVIVIDLQRQQQTPSNVIGLSADQIDELDDYNTFLKVTTAIKEADILLAYLPVLSINVLINIGIAHKIGTPIILVSDSEKYLCHTHIHYTCHWRYRDIDTALKMLTSTAMDGRQMRFDLINFSKQLKKERQNGSNGCGTLPPISKL